MAKINTILFDFDGTLMDTNALIIESWQHLFRTMGVQERTVEEITKTLGEPLLVTMKNWFPDVDISEYVSVYRDFHRARFEAGISLFPGMGELVVSLKEKGYKLGLVTSRMTWSTTLGLEKYKLKEYFDAIVTADDTDKHKPDPEPVYIALRKLNAKAEESIMIGDTKFDILSAKRAGVKSVLVDWSIVLSEADRVGENVPDHTIKSAEELHHILDGRYA